MIRSLFKRRLHSSWLIAITSAAVFVGVVLAPIVAWQFHTFSWLLTGITLVVFAAAKQRIWLALLAVIGGLVIGLWRGDIEQADLTAYESLGGATIQLRGKVSDDADIDKHGNTVLRLSDISYKGQAFGGKIWVTLNKKLPIERSDEVVVAGKLQAGFGTFVASIYRAEIKRIDRPQPGDVALHVRDWFAGAVRNAISEPQASLGVGYLVGQRRALPPELDEALKIAGLTHIVVASGYNLTILVRLARRLFEKVSRYLSFIFSAGLIFSFIAVTGSSPSMSRAGLVAGLSLLAWYYGHKFNPIILLLIAVATTVLVNPSYAWGDVGWQLSFAAFGGVMILAPLLQAYYFGNKKPGLVRQIFGETFSAWLCTLPILMYSFGLISNVAIFANILILPLVPLAMLLTFIAGLGGLLTSFLSPVFAQIVGFPAEVLLSYMTQTARYMANVPWAQNEVALQLWQVLGFYGVLILACVYMQRKTKLNLRDSNIVE